MSCKDDLERAIQESFTIEVRYLISVLGSMTVERAGAVGDSDDEME